jgi:hypothetical protein
MASTTLLIGRLATALLLLAIAGPPARADAPGIAAFDFELIDTSQEGSSPDQDRRLRLISDALRRQLAASGRYTVVDIAPVRARLAAGPALTGCNGCELDAARVLGAELVAVGVVHKMSTLILSMRLLIREVPSGNGRLLATASIRGNTDESWLHDINWLVRNRILAASD